MMTKKNFSYNEAIQEIEEILFEVEKKDVDIDELSDKVKRVSFLINACKNKLLKTEEQIDKILENTNNDE
ncbi:MAG: exodeoxyribonuclease VII small subunit [Bacteroidetes bacterium]|nr:MAG: exodeoxyribonuclease VII small subunit [Bacteroidota bacterium]